MKRLFIFWVILLPALTQHVHAQYYSVNYDARTVAAIDRKSTRLNSSHNVISRMPSSA